MLHHVVQDVSELMFCDYYMFVHKMNKVDFEVHFCFCTYLLHNITIKLSCLLRNHW